MQLFGTDLESTPYSPVAEAIHGHQCCRDFSEDDIVLFMVDVAHYFLVSGRLRPKAFQAAHFGLIRSRSSRLRRSGSRLRRLLPRCSNSSRAQATLKVVTVHGISQRLLFCATSGRRWPRLRQQRQHARSVQHHYLRSVCWHCRLATALRQLVAWDKLDVIVPFASCKVTRLAWGILLVSSLLFGIWTLPPSRSSQPVLQPSYR